MTTFHLYRKAETDCSTWGELVDAAGATLCKILERGARNPGPHVRIPAGTYALARKPFGDSHFDPVFRGKLGAVYKGILWLPHVPGRSNIEIHTANIVQQLEGCLATGEAIERDSHNDFMVAGGTSIPAYERVYPVISAAIDAGETFLDVRDIG